MKTRCEHCGLELDVRDAVRYCEESVQDSHFIGTKIGPVFGAQTSDRWIDLCLGCYEKELAAQKSDIQQAVCFVIIFSGMFVVAALLVVLGIFLDIRLEL